MKFSLITLTYNSEKTIVDTLKSIKTQNYNNIDHIIIDGASSDKTIDLIRKFKIKKSVFISQKDKGIYYALNKAIKKTSGDVIGILHSDDVFNNSNIIKNIANVFKKTEANIVYGDIEYVNTNFKTVRKWVANTYEFQKKILNSIKYIELFKKGWMPPHTGFFFKKNLIKKNIFFDTKYKISSDYDFMFKIISKSNSKIYYCPILITKMRIGGKSNSFKNIFMKSWEDYKIIKKNKLGGFLTLCLKNTKKLKQFL